jgi:hypothetical protein
VRNILTLVPGKKEKQPLSVTHPELAKEADGWDPSEISIGFRKLCWVCENRHRWVALVSSRQRGHGCPYCSGRRVWVGFNDLRTKKPELAIELLEDDPELFTIGSHQKVSWKGKCGHIWVASIKDRALSNRGCPVCAGKKIIPGINDFKTLRPEIASEAFGWDPELISLNSGKKLSWRCSLGHIWETRVADRAIGAGCPFCQNDKVLSGFNDLLTTDPELAAEAIGWDPRTVTRGSDKTRMWKCSFDHRWEASIDSRRSGNGCPYCTSKKVLKGFNDLQSRFPELALEAEGWDPSEEFAFSSKNFLWKCPLGHKWRTSIATRSTGSNCPSCSKTGFNPNAEGYLYFLLHPTWNMFQIGITNTPDNRLGEHKAIGWEVLELRGPMDGHLTQQWETAILRMLKAKGADLSNKDIAGKFDGYSEAWSKSTFEVESIRELMQLTEEFESQ